MSTPGGDAPEEAWAGDSLLVFDGRVVEVFGFPGSESMRFHVANLSLTVAGPDRKGRHDVTLKPRTRGSGGCMFQVEAEGWPPVEALLGRVGAASEATRH